MKYLCIFAFFGTSCVVEREDGPHSSEYGLVTYWEVVSSLGRTDKCTDSADWSEVVSGPVLNAGSYLMYRVEEGGLTAAGQSCETLSSSSCSDSDVVWDVNEHILVYTADPQRLLNDDEECALFLYAQWTVVDEGRTPSTIVDRRR